MKRFLKTRSRIIIYCVLSFLWMLTLRSALGIWFANILFVFLGGEALFYVYDAFFDVFYSAALFHQQQHGRISISLFWLLKFIVYATVSLLLIVIEVLLPIRILIWIGFRVTALWFINFLFVLMGCEMIIFIMRHNKFIDVAQQKTKHY